MALTAALSMTFFRLGKNCEEASVKERVRFGGIWSEVSTLVAPEAADFNHCTSSEQQVWRVLCVEFNMEKNTINVVYSKRLLLKGWHDTLKFP